MRRQRLLLSSLVYVALLYLLPLQSLLRRAWPPYRLLLSTDGVAGLPDPLALQLHRAYLLAMLAAYVAVGLLVSWCLRLLHVYQWEQALAWLEKVTSVKDLRGLDRFLSGALPLVALGAILAIPLWGTEALAVLAIVVSRAVRAQRGEGARPVVPLPGPQPPQPLPQEDVPGGEVRKRYFWHFPEQVGARRNLPAREFAVELLLSAPRYQELRQRERQRDARRWAAYVTEPAPEVEVLAGRLLAIGREQGFRSYDQATNVLAFTQQCIHYELDLAPGTAEEIEYPKYPIESLMEEKGDCEDHAILMAALLKRMGYDVALLLCPGHAAVGVAGAEGLPG
ncbi:MAG: hypothetical protein QME94_20010, partial [Anaerolineae bacterium]|nr:hypothetical protein [Anaerolineae bacterium]